jgi:hypothetical protein
MVRGGLRSDLGFGFRGRRWGTMARGAGAPGAGRPGDRARGRVRDRHGDGPGSRLLVWAGGAGASSSTKGRQGREDTTGAMAGTG